MSAHTRCWLLTAAPGWIAFAAGMLAGTAWLVDGAEVYLVCAMAAWPARWSVEVEW